MRPTIARGYHGIPGVLTLYMLGLDEAIDLIQGCDSVPALRGALQRIAEAHGFASFGFVDAGTSTRDPLWIATSDPAWIEDYTRNYFLDHDPAVAAVRRTNKPFSWSDLPTPRRAGRRKPIALKIMEAAHDYGFTDGLVVPFHLVDRLGRVRSLSCGFYWRGPRSRFSRIPQSYRTNLHILMIYWCQRVLDLAEGLDDREPVEGAALLTDRERLVLEWAARGKTALDTAAILSISAHTVDTHIRSAISKLAATNKTHAAALALKAGVIYL